ncbi:MAG: hypothetical protein ACLQF1_09395 [Methyloceanibacter sp.]|jgi:hypothetical protein
MDPPAEEGQSKEEELRLQNRSFCRTREGLLRCVREYCGEVDADALAKLEALPDFHVDWKKPK